MPDTQTIETIKNVIVEILAAMGIVAEVEPEDTLTNGLVFNLTYPESKLLIGRQGSHLHALQVLSQALVSKRLQALSRVSFSLDVDDYRRKREWYLRQTAKAAAENASFTGRSVKMEVMPHYERRVVHEFIQNNYPDVESESIGREPYRSVIIKKK